MKKPHISLFYTYNLLPFLLTIQLVSEISENKWISILVFFVVYGLLVLLKKKILEQYEFKEVNRTFSTFYFLTLFCSLIYLKVIHWEKIYLTFCLVNLAGMHFFLKRKTEE